ncbi:DUF3298 and DUF4163 domain-containing protein [Mucilaginibacter gilvus]|uniref:DUF3298 domain-containing protein n=1 Tax=Mucilaginibacter gilvus TaxID=2305909 RepID=A0A3S4Y9L6_9SPHI|nr:DUF3298 and DUF4163 domain-containing protein [Mucilaginibacter gilvus]RWY50371.1 DUF3298 domain-containing protein [Mucilaginibacter gilvus]
MRLTFLLGLVLFALTSCNFGRPKNNKPDIFKDTVAYTMQSIHERANDCGNKADSACTVAKIAYPVFKAQEALNDSLKRGLLNINFSDNISHDTSLKMMTDRYFEEYADFKKYNKTEDRFFTIDTYAKVVNQDSSLLALEYGGYVYEGGAHGADFTEFINWNPNTKRGIYLKDILLPGAYPKLTKIAEEIFRKNEKLKDTSSLARDYFFRDNKFWLNENYLFTPVGIRFVYNEYEIKPYAAGQTELLIPWAQIKTLIRPNAVVAPYTKKDAGI